MRKPRLQEQHFFFFLLLCGSAVLLYFLLRDEEESGIEVSDSEVHFVCRTKPPQHEGKERLEDKCLPGSRLPFLLPLCVCASLPFGEEVKGRSNRAY